MLKKLLLLILVRIKKTIYVYLLHNAYMDDLIVILRAEFFLIPI